MLRSLDIPGLQSLQNSRALAAKPLTGCKSRLGHPRFSRKTGRAAPLPFLIKQATHSPYFRTSPGAGVGLGAPELSFSAGICDLAGACPRLRRRMRQASSPPAPSWFHPVGAGERPSCRTALASVAVRTLRQRSRATPCSPTRPNAPSYSFLFFRCCRFVGRETTARGDAGSCGESSRGHRRLPPALARCVCYSLRDARAAADLSERILGCGRRDTAGEKSPVRATSYVRVDLQSLQPEQRGMTPGARRCSSPASTVRDGARSFERMRARSGSRLLRCIRVCGLRRAPACPESGGGKAGRSVLCR